MWWVSNLPQISFSQFFCQHHFWYTRQDNWQTPFNLRYEVLKMCKWKKMRTGRCYNVIMKLISFTNVLVLNVCLMYELCYILTSKKPQSKSKVVKINLKLSPQISQWFIQRYNNVVVVLLLTDFTRTSKHWHKPKSVITSMKMSAMRQDLEWHGCLEVGKSYSSILSSSPSRIASGNRSETFAESHNCKYLILLGSRTSFTDKSFTMSLYFKNFNTFAKGNLEQTSRHYVDIQINNSSQATSATLTMLTHFAIQLSKIIWKSFLTSWVSWLSLVISALSCRPNTSGVGIRGRVLK